MKPVLLLSGVLLFGLTPDGFAAPAAVEAAALDQAFARLQTYDWSDSHEALNAIEQAVVATHNDSARRRELEKRLAAVLASPAPRAAKDFTCRQLGVVGTSQSVPALATLLSDPDLSHMARLALERIPAAAAAAALRDALPKTQGKIKIGIINSLGTLADAKAVGALTGLMAGADPSVAVAAAQALGKIGTTKAVEALEKLRPAAPRMLQPAVAEACIVAGENLLAKGQRTAAARIFRNALEQETGTRRLAGFQGLLRAEPKRAVKRLGDALAGDDEPLRDLAARIITELPGDNALKPFLDLLPSLPTAGQVALLDAIHSRRDACARPAVLAACDNVEPRVRLAAIRALGVVGTAEDIPRLAHLASAKGDSEQHAARLALANLPGREPSDAILKSLADASPPVRTEMIQSLAARGAIEAAPALARYLDAVGVVRLAALEALAVLGDEKQAAAIISFLKTASNDRLFQSAGKTFEAIVSRSGPACRDALLSGAQNAKPEVQIVVLEQLGRIGGSEALKAVRAAVNTGDVEVGNAAARALADWPDAEALPDLLKLAQNAGPPARRELAFRGYVRLCRESPMPATERLDRLREAVKLAASKDEKTLVASALADVPEPGSMKLLAAYLDDAALVDAAGVAAVKVASALDTKHKSEVVPVLQRVLERCQNAEIQKQAKAVLKKLEPGIN